MKVFKLLLPDEMRRFREEGVMAGTDADRADGFIHLSTAEHLQATARRHYGQVEHMWILRFDEAELGAALAWEPSRGGELFPHLYGPLNKHDLEWDVRVTRKADQWELPADWLLG